MSEKEAAARIKINKLLEAADWRFFADAKGPANIQLEPSVTLKTQDLDTLGENFEKAAKGFIDFLLLNEKASPPANRELIARFEKKIQATLARIWGEEAPSGSVAI